MRIFVNVLNIFGWTLKKIVKIHWTLEHVLTTFFVSKNNILLGLTKDSILSTFSNDEKKKLFDGDKATDNVWTEGFGVLLSSLGSDMHCFGHFILKKTIVSRLQLQLGMHQKLSREPHISMVSICVG